MKSLKIKNLILIEEAEIAFGPGLNILTGETGAGKSAILSAIRLISGERADSQCIRKGADLAVVEAVFEGPTFLRREIHRSGKNRCFIDDEQVTLAALREAVQIEMIDQNSAHALFQERRLMLDRFANLLSEVSAYEASHAEEMAKKSELEKLLQIPKERELEWAQKDWALFEELHYQVGEEEKLGQEHHFLTHAQELVEKVEGIAFTLNEEGALASLKRALSQLDAATRFDAKLIPIAQSMKSALLELDEISRSIQRYATTLETEPKRLMAVEERLSAITTLKRRFGPDLTMQKEKIAENLDRLAHLDAQIASLHTQLEVLHKKNEAWSQEITEKRAKAASPFANATLQELQSLNLPHAQFAIAVGPQYGEISFLFSANLGTPLLPIQECASGGELSRLLLAIQTILSQEGCLVFDEIDSNVGGHTATILGEKLQKIASKRQVICVTHFVQVAKCAMDHFLVSKIEKEANAYTTIRKLDRKGREQEYERMLGIKL